MAARSWQMRVKIPIKHVVITRYKETHETIVRNGIIIAWIFDPGIDGLNISSVAFNDTH